METITVVVAATDNYGKGAAAVLRSIEETLAEGYQLDAVVLSSGIRPATRQRIVASLPGSSVRFVDVPDHPEAHWLRGPLGAPARGHFARIFIPELVDVPRAIYLDVDMIVQKSLHELWETDLEGHLAAAVVEVLSPTVSSLNGVQRWWRLTDDPFAPYFNSGMLLMDLDAWRRADITGEVIRYARDNGSRILLSDQETLNAVLLGRWKVLDSQWNRTQFTNWQDAAIIHYLLPVKPWHTECVHPAAYLYHDVRSRTAFADEGPEPFAPPPSRRLQAFRRVLDRAFERTEERPAPNYFDIVRHLYGAGRSDA